MKINAKTLLRSGKVTLVPYKKKHVAKYHDWMKSPELQELTASEPLSLEEEYQMQKKWREDEDKLTFIVLDTETYDRTHDEIAAMVGDTNLFFTKPGDNFAEIEVMIADPIHRRRGLGREALVLMMVYAVNTLGVQTFIAKIKLKNAPSKQMFEKLGFEEVKRSTIFEEITYRTVLHDWKALLALHNATYEPTAA